MEGKLYLRDSEKNTDGLFQTHSIEACEIPDILLDMEVCCIGTYFDCDMNYVSVELE